MDVLEAFLKKFEGLEKNALIISKYLENLYAELVNDPTSWVKTKYSPSHEQSLHPDFLTLDTHFQDTT